MPRRCSKNFSPKTNINIILSFVIIILFIFSSIPHSVSGDNGSGDIPLWLHEELGTDPEDPKSPGVYVMYDNGYRTLDYNTWDTYQEPGGTETKTIATERVVIRRGTELKIGGYKEGYAEIHPAVEGMTTLEIQEVEDGWQIQIPPDSSVGTYTFTLTQDDWTDELDIFVIYDPWTLDMPEDELKAYAYDEGSVRPEKEYIFTTGHTLHEGTLHPFGDDRQDMLDMYEFALSAVAGSKDTRESAARIVRVVAQRGEAIPSSMANQPIIRDASQILFGSGTTVLHGEEFEYTGLTLEDAEVLSRNGQTIEGIDGLTDEGNTMKINAWCDEVSWAKTALLRAIGIPSRVASVHPTEDTDLMGHFMVEVWFEESLYQSDWSDSGGGDGWYVLDADQWNAEWYVAEPTFWMPAGECFSSRSNYGRMAETLYKGEYKIYKIYVPGTGEIDHRDDLIDVTQHYIGDEELLLDYGELTKLKGRGGGDYFRVELENISRLSLESSPTVEAGLYVSKMSYPVIPIAFEGYPFSSQVESYVGDEVVLGNGTYYISIYAPKNGSPAVEGDFGEYTLTLEETPNLTPNFEEGEIVEEDDERRTDDWTFRSYAIATLLFLFWIFAYVLKKKTN
ncbi:MAG: transglutaminase-like domain-containing protein [Candidatus Saliniplasma sp.]